MNDNKGIIYAELYEILKSIDKMKVMKVPIDILNTIIRESDKNYNINIDWSRPLEEQNLHEDTINVLGWINLNYWAETEEEKDNLKRLYLNNIIASEETSIALPKKSIVDSFKEIIGKK